MNCEMKKRKKDKNKNWNFSQEKEMIFKSIELLRQIKSNQEVSV